MCCVDALVGLRTFCVAEFKIHYCAIRQCCIDIQVLEEPSLDWFIECKREGLYSLCVSLQIPLSRPNEEWVHRVSVIFSCLDFTACPIMPLFPKIDIFCITKEIFLTYFVTVCMSSTTKSIGAIMIVIDEVAFGSGKFKVSAVLAQNGKFSSAIWSKASVIICKSSLLMFFLQKRLCQLGPVHAQVWNPVPHSSHCIWGLPFPVIYAKLAGCILCYRFVHRVE